MFRNLILLISDDGVKKSQWKLSQRGGERMRGDEDTKQGEQGKLV